VRTLASAVYRETLRQAQFSGYTTAVLIINAIRMYPDFPWAGLVQGAGILVNEFATYNADAAALDADAYAAYGNVKPQGNARYPHLTHIYMYVR